MLKEAQHPECIKFQARTAEKVEKLEKHAISFFKMLRGSADDAQDAGIIGRMDMIEHENERFMRIWENQEKEQKANKRARGMVIFSSVVSVIAAIAVAFFLSRIDFK